jgi:tetratricopeptide (TPR) repeat protein
VPLNRVEIPSGQEKNFPSILKELQEIDGPVRADWLLATVENILGSIGSDYREFAATLKFEASSALLNRADLTEGQYTKSIEYLRSSLAARNSSDAPLERALALIALGRAPERFVNREEALACLREAEELLRPLPEQLDHVIACEALGSLLADSKSIGDLEEAVALVSQAVSARRQSRDILGAVEAARLLGQISLNLVDAGHRSYLQLAFECQAEATAAYNEVSLSKAGVFRNHASAVADLAEVCLVGVELVAQAGTVQHLHELAATATLGAELDEVRDLLPSARVVFEFLDQNHDVSLPLLTPSPDLRSGVETMIKDWIATTNELVRREVSGSRTPVHTPGLLRRFRATEK